MSNRVQLSADLRSKTGKGVNRRLRAAGSIPAIFYGPGMEPISLAVNPKALKAAVSGPLKMNTLLEFDIKDGEKSVDTKVAVLKDYQIHPLRRHWLHADFVSIDLSKPMEVRIPIELTGKPVGVVNGGMIQVIRRDIGITCLPEKIPAKIEFDITTIDIGDNLHVRDIPLPEGAAPVDNPNFAILTCVAPLQEKEATEEETEGEAGTESTEASSEEAKTE